MIVFTMMIREIPSDFKRLYSKEDIAYSVYKMAGRIRHWVKDTHETVGQQVLAICVLRGGVFFFADLLKEIPSFIVYGSHIVDGAYHNVIKPKNFALTLKDTIEKFASV